MLSQDKINELNRKRLNIRTRIREHLAKGSDTAKLVQEYNDFLEIMKFQGVPYDYRWELSYSNKTGAKSIPIKPKIQSNPNQTKPIQSNPIEDKYCILNIAWTESSKGTDTKTIELLDEYLKAVSEADIYDDSSDDSFEIEHIIKYKYKTSKQAFNIIKQSSQFIKDKIADPSKDQIEIFGKILGPS